MAFYARNFIFDGKASENYNLVISSTEPEAETDAPANIRLITEKLLRRQDEYLYGTSIEPTLEFDVRFSSDNGEITADEYRMIARWLFGKTTYKDLVIIQDDMSEVKYPCFLINPIIVRTGNIITGLGATVKCKYAWGIGRERDYTYNFTPPLSNYYFKHTNYSDNSGYTYPIFIVTMNVNGGTFSVKNASDNDRITSITTLLGNEVVTMNSDRQTITANMGISRLPYFNKYFFRLLPGANNLYATGNISSIVIRYADAKKIGG